VSEGNREVVRSFLDAANAGNMDTCFGLLADDLVWTDIGSTRFAGRYEGKGSVLQDLIGPLFAQLKSGIHTTIERIVAEGEYVVVQSRGEAETVAGVPYNNSYCQVFTVRDGLIREVVEYCDTALVNQVLS